MELNQVSNILNARGLYFPANNFKNEKISFENSRTLAHPDSLFISTTQQTSFQKFSGKSNNINFNINEYLPIGKIFSKISGFFSGKSDEGLTVLQERAVKSADLEWKKGARESSGKNRSPMIDQYARNSGHSAGGAWCGYFVGYNYSQAGFKYPESFSGMRKTRDFFLYRKFNYSADKPVINAEMEKLKLEQRNQGNERKLFLLQESPTIAYLQKYPPEGFDIKANTFDYFNLPVRSGDVVLLYPGHMGIVSSYNNKTGKLVTIEGNTTGKTVSGKVMNDAVAYKEYDLTKPSVRGRFSGFGRPSQDDFR